MVTSDGGATWNSIEISKPAEWDTIAKYKYPDDVLCFGPGRFLATIIGPGFVRAFARSTDNGNNWTILFPVVPGRDTLVTGGNRFSIVDRSQLFVTYFESVGGTGFGSTGLFASTDGGATWQSRFTSRPGAIARFQHTSFRDPLNGLAAGPLEIYGTTDGGRSWQIELDSFLSLTQVFFRRGHPGFVLSERYGSVWLRSAGTTRAANEDRVEGRDQVRVVGDGEIEIVSTASADASLIVYDVCGRVRYRSVLNLSAGERRTVELADLPLGFSMVMVRINGQTSVVRLAH